MRRVSSWTAVAALVALFTGAPAVSQDTVRLQQEFNNLKFRFDYETNRLERRLETLERQVRQAEYRAPSPGLATPVPVPVPDFADEVTARRLIVTDAEGRIRGVLAVSELYGPMLGLLNEHGDVVGMFAASDEGTRLEIFDNAARPRVLLGLDDGDPVLELRDQDGEVLGEQ